MTERLTRLLRSEDAATADLAEKHPIGRLGVPSDITGTVLFLACNHSGFITGPNLVVDGGYLAQ